MEHRARAQRLRTHARDRRAAHRYATVLLPVLGTFLFVAFAPDNRSMRGILLLYAPLGDVARTLANMEALFGQLYLVTVIGVLVSRIPAARRAEV